MASYDISQYVLDRENIHDTRSEAGLANEVFAPTVYVGYTSYMSDPPPYEGDGKQ
jgi:type IV secretory pathway component VirB8